MNRKEINKRISDLQKEISKLSVPADPNKKKRCKLMNEIDDLYQLEVDYFEKAIKDTRKLLKTEIAELKKMCRGTFSGAIPVKAQVRVKLNISPCNLDTYDSTCGVQIEFPKSSRNLGLFIIDEDEELSYADIHIAAHAKGLLPDLDKHIDKLNKLHASIVKKIKAEAKKLDVVEDLEDFIDEVLI